MNMFQVVIKQLWSERRQTVWLLLELTVVFLFLLMEVDFSWIKLKNYMEPRGFDVTNTYQLKLKRLAPGEIGYRPADELEQTESEMLEQLVGQVRLYPDVEEVGISTSASPVAGGGWWTTVFRRDSLGQANLQGRAVDEGYLRVFRLCDHNGKLLDLREADRSRLLVSRLACDQFGYASVADVPGDTLYMDTGNDVREPYPAFGVFMDLKSRPFRPYQASFFLLMSRQEWNERLQQNQAQRMELWVRVREGSDVHFREYFEREMAERLWAGQIYVSSIISMEDEVAKGIDTEMKQNVEPMMYVLLFVLLTAFLGVFGTFWLRTRLRRSEIGIRMVMGASRSAIGKLFFLEGLCLTSVAVFPALLIYVNLLRAEILNVYDLPYTGGRVLLVAVVSLFILQTMIFTGIWFPARKASRLRPTDALHYE